MATARYRAVAKQETTASASSKKEKFGSNPAMDVWIGAVFSDERKQHVRRHMNFLQACISGKASPTSAQISEIARGAASRDVVRCGVHAARS
jgi:hypothetical protein